MAAEQASVPIPRARPSRKVRLREWQATLISLLYLLPSLVAFTIFVFYPVIKSIWISLHADNPFGGTSDIYVGLDQYKSALSSPDYQNSLKITLLYTLYTVPAGLAVALLLAVMANLRLRAISIFRVAFAITIGVSVGAGATNVVVYSIYRDAFFNFHSAYASAQAVILFVILVALTG
ncbi:MAG: hypothetical protein LC793_15630, partial [Thermomicrobia bacterium]|nr:hypothetical protein [Thermomicrobia bacterium]